MYSDLENAISVTIIHIIIHKIKSKMYFLPQNVIFIT